MVRVYRVNEASLSELTEFDVNPPLTVLQLGFWPGIDRGGRTAVMTAMDANGGVILRVEIASLRFPAGSNCQLWLMQQAEALLRQFAESNRGMVVRIEVDGWLVAALHHA
jgi:hypothetical protein